jgi:SAM-dependent methyltransferase
MSLHAENRAGDHVMTGALSCRACRRRYAIDGGVPRLNVATPGSGQVARSFAYQWKTYAAAALAADSIYGRSSSEDWQAFLEFTGATAEDVRGARVLDAGCGAARLTARIGEAGAKSVIGIDFSAAVDEAFERCRHLPNVHIVQANILALPFKPGLFDYVWSMGAVHHTPNPRRAQAALAGQVKPGGTLFVWVYSRRFNPFRLGKSLFDASRLGRLSPATAHWLARGLALLSVGGVWCYRAARRLPGLRPRSEWGRRSLKARSLAELELTWLDALAPEHASRHTESEVVGWFRELGFEDVYAFDDPNIAVRGRARAGTRSPAAGLLTR